MSRKILTLVIVLAFVVSLSSSAWGQTWPRAEIDITGSGNEAHIFQPGNYNNDAWIRIPGNYNNSTILQSTSGQRNRAWTYQAGEGVFYPWANEALIQQVGVGWDNFARIYQYGGNKNEAATYQDGYRNTALISQYDSDNAHNVFVDPWTSAEYIALFNNVPNFNWTQVQIGNDNTATAVVHGDGSDTIQWQQGNRNDATINIGDTDPSGHNHAIQHQTGNDNMSTININGMGNRAINYQNGGHTALINITGNFNEALIEGTGTW